MAQPIDVGHIISCSMRMSLAMGDNCSVSQIHPSALILTKAWEMFVDTMADPRHCLLCLLSGIPVSAKVVGAASKWSSFDHPGILWVGEVTILLIKSGQTISPNVEILQLTTY